MRRPFVCGNWKMHKTLSESVDLIKALIPQTRDFGQVEVGVAPPYTALAAVKTALDGTDLKLVAQNCHFETQGAFTGEVSIPMLKDVGCDYVLVGHSERRQLFGETDEGVGQKVRAVLDHGLDVIVALGERLQERESGQTLAVVERQFAAAFAEVAGAEWSRVVVAYEPVWAIGTGRTASPDQAQEVHAALRARLTDHGEVAAGVRIQYGGSVKPGNAADLFAQPDIDGGLIGGASLKADDFAAICRAA